MSELNTTINKIVTTISGLTDKVSGINVSYNNFKDYVSGNYATNIAVANALQVVSGNINTEHENQVRIISGTLNTAISAEQLRAENKENELFNNNIYISSTFGTRFSPDHTVQYEIDNIVSSAVKVSGLLDNAIQVDTGTDGVSKTIWLKINDNDPILSQTISGLYSTIALNKITSGLPSSMAARYQLVGKNGQQLGQTIDILKDKFLKSATYDETTHTLKFVFILADGSESEQTINLSGLVDVYDAVSGIAKEGSIFRGVVDSASEDYLTVGANGFKVSGIDNAILTTAKQITDIRPLDYTSYAVYANDKIIPTGYNADLDGEVKVAIPSGMTETVYIRSQSKDKLASDVIIDWGDNTKSYISGYNGVPKEQTSDNVHPYTYTMSHTYNKPGKYDVKIYGKDYFSLIHNEKETNLLCECFDAKHNIASHIKNTASFAINAARLLKVAVPVYHNVWNSINWSNCFKGCENLQSVKGFEQFVRTINTFSYMFYGCINLVTCDIVIQGGCMCTATFANCYNLERDIDTILPTKVGGFYRKTINFNNTFLNCKKLTLNNEVTVGKVLWNDLTNEFINTTAAFSTCSEDVRAKVPTSWGGTKVIKTNLDKLDEIIAKIENI